MPSVIHRASFFVVHHSGFLDSFFNAPEHSLEDCDFDRYLSRSETMAERAPLLPQGNSPSYDHPISLLVCHSPWPFLNQKIVFTVRGFLALYLSVVLGMNILQDSKSSESRFTFLFDPRDISFMIQTIYYWITTVRHPRYFNGDGIHVCWLTNAGLDYATCKSIVSLIGSPWLSFHLVFHKIDSSGAPISSG